MTNVLSADSIADKHYKHSAFTATIDASYASPDALPRGITWDGTNVLSADGTSSTEKHYKHSAFTATIDASYASPAISPQGITWDGRHAGVAATSLLPRYGHPMRHLIGR